MQSNSDALKALRGVQRARFYLCDLHVHSPASADVRLGSRFDELGPEEQQLLESIPQGAANDPVEYEKKVEKAFPPSHYYDLLLAQRDTIAQRESISEGEDWAIVALTDHNVCSYTCAVAKHAWQYCSKNRLIVLPGIELHIAFEVGTTPVNVHVLLIYQPGTEASDIRVAIRQMATGDWSFGDMAHASSLPQFIGGVRAHEDYAALAIAAHVASEKGVRQEARKAWEQFAFTGIDASIARTSAELNQNPDADKEALEARLARLREERHKTAKKTSLEALHLIGDCGFDALQVTCKGDAIHYRRLHRFRDSFGRAVPIVASDAHRVSDVFVCENNTPYLKVPVESVMSNPTQVLQELRHAIRYGETRFSYSTPGQVTRWISGLEISPDSPDAAHFWPAANNTNSFVLPLSRNLNCLVGGRGSGKSAAIEGLAFVAEPDTFEGMARKREDNLPDWYKRAQATLDGCHVRLVWQAMGSTADLPKGALFGSRYFKPSGEHDPVAYKNLEGKEVLGSAVSLEPPQLFRARDIENAAEPELLRGLFDRLVGQRIPEIENEIEGLLTELKKQREEMVDIAWQIMELTQDDSPLREYCRRKAAYQKANRPDVQRFYTKLDDTSAAHTIAKRAKKQWDEAIDEADIENTKSEFIRLLDSLQKKMKDQSGGTRPYCESLAKLFASGTDAKSPRNRLEQAFGDLQSELQVVGKLLQSAVEDVESHHKKAREALEKKGLPKGARDREAKKQDFEEAERDHTEYCELMSEWKKRIDTRRELFSDLETKSKERTKLRKETADRLTERLERDLDPSVLTIAVRVHEVEDNSDFFGWLTDNIGPSILKLKNARLQAILDKGVMPEDVRNALLGERTDAPSVFEVDEERARDGRVEPDLVAKILHECSGRVHLEPEHIGVADQGEMDEKFVDELPKEIRDGLWTFPRKSSEAEDLILDAVLALDEVVFDDRPEILLNDRPGETGSTLRPISDLSPGQRCSAILPILLLNGRSPLIIDQPEDNLDNRLIRQVIVNILASIKLRRQVIIATHNPNLPVLGDVEQAIVLRAVEEKQSQLEWTGDLDSAETVHHLTDIMEGGREAFQYRQSIYQAHWEGPVSRDQAGP